MMSLRKFNAKAQSCKGAKNFFAKQTGQAPMSIVKFYSPFLCGVASLRRGVKQHSQRCGLTLVLVLLGSQPLSGQTNSETTNAVLQLSPPLKELPPTLWEQIVGPEQRGMWVIIVALVAIVLIASAVWLRIRRKTHIIPPETQARRELESLLARSEDGALLSRVSQILRNYFIAAFQLPPGELTTSEFLRVISGSEQIGPELSTIMANFLRESDERKFSPANSPAPSDAVNRALKIVALAEQRRAQLRQLAETQVSAHDGQF